MVPIPTAMRAIIRLGRLWSGGGAHAVDTRWATVLLTDSDASEAVTPVISVAQHVD